MAKKKKKLNVEKILIELLFGFLIGVVILGILALMTSILILGFIEENFEMKMIFVGTFTMIVIGLIWWAIPKE